MNTVDWLTTQIAPGTQVQVIGFSDKVTWLIPDSEGEWVTVADGRELDAPVEALRASYPQGPTSLAAAFNAIKVLNPKPDNIYLLTDGLPTMGDVMPTRAGRQREGSPRPLGSRRAAVARRRARQHDPVRDGRRPAGGARVLDARDPHGRLDARALRGLAMKRRRDFDIFSMSFLDAVCCGFGAMILLFIVTRTSEPARLEQSERDLSGLIAQYEQELNDIVGETERVQRNEATTTASVQTDRRKVEDLREQLELIRAQVLATAEDTELTEEVQNRLASAKQSLTDEMRRLLAELSAADRRVQGRRHSRRQRVHHLLDRHLGQHERLPVGARAAAAARDARGLSRRSRASRS